MGRSESAMTTPNPASRPSPPAGERSVPADLVAEAVFWLDRMGRVEAMNAAARKAFPEIAEAAGKTFGERVRAEDRSRWNEAIARARAGETVDLECATTAGGNAAARSGRLTLRGERDAVVVVVRGPAGADEEDEEERSLRRAMLVGRLGTFEWDMVQDRVRWSPELEEVYGLKRGAGVAKFADWVKHVVPEDAARVQREIEACIREGRADHAYEFRAIWPDGTRRWLAGQGRFSFDAAGRAVRMIGVNGDIHERKWDQIRADFVVQLGLTVRPLLAPREIAEAMVRLLAESLEVDRCAYAVFEPDGDTFTVVGNHARGLPPMVGSFSLAAFGPEVAATQHAGRPFALDDAEAAGLSEAERAVFAQTGIRAVIAVPLLKEGRLVAGVAVHHRTPRRWSMEEIQLVELAANACWESIERARVAADLHASERRLRLALTSAQLVAWEVDPATGKAVVMENAAQLFGLPPDAALEDIEAGFRLMHPEDVAAHREIFLRTMREGGSHQTQFRMLRADGKGVKWIEERAYLARDDSGKPQRFVGIMIDITERKRAEEELREAHALLADKAKHLETLVQQRTAKLQETIGELEAFSYSVAHDLRAPLRTMEGFARILLEEHAASLAPEARDHLRRIAKSASRMDRLTRDVLSYSRVVRDAAPRERVEVQALVDDLLETYPQFAHGKAEIRVARPLPPVLGNTPLLTQVLSNLLGNAVKFVAPGVRPEVAITAATSGGRVRVTIADNGIGVPPEQRDKIFEMFEQLSRSYEGTGIGLAIARKAMERMGGAIGVRPRAEGGSEFWFELPAAEGPTTSPIGLTRGAD